MYLIYPMRLGMIIVSLEIILIIFEHQLRIEQIFCLTAIQLFSSGWHSNTMLALCARSPNGLYNKLCVNLILWTLAGLFGRRFCYKLSKTLQILLRQDICRRPWPLRLRNQSFARRPCPNAPYSLSVSSSLSSLSPLPRKCWWIESV